MLDIHEIINRMGLAHYKIGGQWVRIQDIAEQAGLTRDEIAAGIQELMSEDTFRAEPQPFTHRITDWDRENAPVIGGEARHLISWE